MLTEGTLSFCFMFHNQAFKFIAIKKRYQLTEQACMTYHLFNFPCCGFFGFFVLSQ